MGDSDTTEIALTYGCLIHPPPDVQQLSLELLERAQIWHGKVPCYGRVFVGWCHGVVAGSVIVASSWWKTKKRSTPIVYHPFPYHQIAFFGDIPYFQNMIHG
jgi:hypothetical protein